MKSNNFFKAGIQFEVHSLCLNKSSDKNPHHLSRKLVLFLNCSYVRKFFLITDTICVFFVFYFCILRSVFQIFQSLENKVWVLTFFYLISFVYLKSGVIYSFFVFSGFQIFSQSLIRFKSKTLVARYRIINLRCHKSVCCFCCIYLHPTSLRKQPLRELKWLK